MNAIHPLVDEIEDLFVRHGDRPYPGARSEPVTALEHALQCAQLAEWAQSSAALVTAALLHDIGHLLVLDRGGVDDTDDDRHEILGADWLCAAFGSAVTEPIRLHVDAKRCLVHLDPAYAAALSPASRHSLALQGGPMTETEAVAFRRREHAREALMLRRLDDLAKDPGRRTPSLGYYLALAREQAFEPAWTDDRVVIGPVDVV